MSRRSSFGVRGLTARKAAKNAKNASLTIWSAPSVRRYGWVDIADCGLQIAESKNQNSSSVESICLSLRGACKQRVHHPRSTSKCPKHGKMISPRRFDSVMNGVVGNFAVSENFRNPLSCVAKVRPISRKLMLEPQHLAFTLREDTHLDKAAVSVDTYTILIKNDVNVVSGSFTPERIGGN